MNGAWTILLQKVKIIIPLYFNDVSLQQFQFTRNQLLCSG
jgi:hypothetical protein